MFNTWNVRSLYRASVTELSKYKLDLVEVQGVRWDEVGIRPAREYILFFGKGNENHELGTVFLCAEDNHISS
jgi:hypothetical protein